jgi:hypothetical protein
MGWILWGYALLSVSIGKAGLWGRHSSHRWRWVDSETDPQSFWIIIALAVVVGAFCVFSGPLSRLFSHRPSDD